MIDTIIKIMEKYGYVYAQGLAGTLCLAGITIVAGTAVGTALALMRMAKLRPLELFVKGYVWVLRGAPILLQLYFFWILLPRVLPFEIPDVACIIIALIVNSGAYVAEIIRAGVQAVDSGQMEAARSLGLTGSQAMFKVVLPQAVRNILPALGNDQAGVPGVRVLHQRADHLLQDGAGGHLHSHRVHHHRRADLPVGDHGAVPGGECDGVEDAPGGGLTAAGKWNGSIWMIEDRRREK